MASPYQEIFERMKESLRAKTSALEEELKLARNGFQEALTTLSEAQERRWAAIHHATSPSAPVPEHPSEAQEEQRWAAIHRAISPSAPVPEHPSKDTVGEVIYLMAYHYLRENNEEFLAGMVTGMVLDAGVIEIDGTILIDGQSVPVTSMDLVVPECKNVLICHDESDEWSEEVKEWWRRQTKEA